MKENPVDFTRLYVGNLAPTIGEEEVRDLFQTAGGVLSVHLVRFSSGQSYAFVQMVSPETARQAIQQYHNADLAGRQLIVYTVPPPSQPRRP